MFSAIGFVVKAAAFALLVLVLGQVVRWEGRTISDQVRSHLAVAERTDTAMKIRGLANGISRDAAQGARVKPSSPGAPDRELAPSERQKLRALIEELNRTH